MDKFGGDEGRYFEHLLEARECIVSYTLSHIENYIGNSYWCTESLISRSSRLHLSLRI